MSITVVSTTEPTDAVKAANAVVAPTETVEDTNSASATSAAGETAETSEISENAEDDVLASEEDDANEGDESVVNDEAKAPKKKGGFQKKIDKLTRERSEAQRKADYWEAERERIRQSQRRKLQWPKLKRRASQS